MQPPAHLDLHLVVTTEAVLLQYFPEAQEVKKENFYAGDSQTVRRGIFQNIVNSLNLCVLFFQTAT